ncbi:MAG: galactokinase [Bacteroidales bacterium]|nr:galactokinase [Bacteroidales bacterium]
MINPDSLKKKFFEIYGNPEQEPRLFFAPGRVNLIGEHTDYNGGYVFPCALNYGTYLLIRETNDDFIQFASVNMDWKGTIALDELGIKKGEEWVNYPLGVIDQLKKNGIVPKGGQLLYAGDIPNGAGLSSSASIELVTSYALNKLWKGNLLVIDLVKLSQKAENEFVGMNCGIMDQFAVGMGKKDKALFLNCETLDYELVPLDTKNYRLVIVNTNKRRGLTDSKYNERRKECEIAVKYLSKEKPIQNLSELTLDEFKRRESLIPDETIRKRAKHVISENDRVLKAVPALKEGKLEEFGRLMNESHDSLRYDYEVTGYELDTLVDESRKVTGVIGSRMTGAGFGGCTVSLVEESRVDQFCEEIGESYTKITGLEPDFYLPEVGEGTREL